MRLRPLFLLAVAAMLPPLVLAGQQVDAERPVRWRVDVPSGARRVAAGGRVKAAVVARIDEGWKLYSLTQASGGPTPTRIALGSSAPFHLAGAIVAQPPESYPDRNFNIFTEIYHDSARFTMPLRAAADARPGAVTLPVVVSYQTCTDRYCLPPRTDTVTVALTLVAPSTPAVVAVEPATLLPVDASSPAVSRQPSPVPIAPAVATTATAATDAASLGRFLALAAVVGLLSLLTPCILPLLPITVGIIVRRDDATDRGTSLLAPIAHAAGIVGTFVAVGIAASTIYGAGGIVQLAANPWLNLGLAALFVAIALNLLGTYELTLPTSLLTRASALGRGTRGRAGAAFLMGAVFAVTSFTCTAPFVGTLLVLAAQGGWRWPLLGLLTYALAFASPFVVLALMPRLLRRLPRGGSWMTSMKAALGVVELALAAKFVSNADLVLGWGVFTREVVLALWMTAALLVALVASGAVRFAGAPVAASGRRIGGRLGAVVALGVAVWLSGGLRGARLGELDAYLPPSHASSAVALAAGEPEWMLNDLAGGLARARGEGRPVLVDFTGYTCTNCRWMEANMFPRQAVRAHLDRFVRVRLYTDGMGEPYASQQRYEQQRFGTVALPLYALIAPTGEPIATFLGMTRDEREFTTFLARAAALDSGATRTAAVRTPDAGLSVAAKDSR